MSEGEHNLFRGRGAIVLGSAAIVQHPGDQPRVVLQGT